MKVSLILLSITLVKNINSQAQNLSNLNLADSSKWNTILYEAEIAWDSVAPIYLDQTKKAIANDSFPTILYNDKIEYYYYKCNSSNINKISVRKYVISQLEFPELELLLKTINKNKFNCSCEYSLKSQTYRNLKKHIKKELKTRKYQIQIAEQFQT